MITNSPATGDTTQAAAWATGDTSGAATFAIGATPERRPSTPPGRSPAPRGSADGVRRARRGRRGSPRRYKATRNQGSRPTRSTTRNRGATRRRPSPRPRANGGPVGQRADVLIRLAIAAPSPITCRSTPLEQLTRRTGRSSTDSGLATPVHHRSRFTHPRADGPGPHGSLSEAEHPVRSITGARASFREPGSSAGWPPARQQRSTAGMGRERDEETRMVGGTAQVDPL